MAGGLPGEKLHLILDDGQDGRGYRRAWRVKLEANGTRQNCCPEGHRCSIEDCCSVSADENTLLSSAVISATAGTQQHQFTLRSGSMVSITASCVLEYYDEMAGAARCAVQSPT